MIIYNYTFYIYIYIHSARTKWNTGIIPLSTVIIPLVHHFYHWDDPNF